MAKQQGNIGITTENIFPVIKKFLYSDHEIFLRELVSNAVDATQKLRALARSGEATGEVGNETISVSIDKEAGTLTVSDHGIGMTAEEVDKYINQIAFSGAGEFLEKYKDDAAAIIGHFGLGFYSSFMVSKRVEILTRSYREGAQAVRWSCDGTPAFEIEDAEKAERGTDIILHIADDCKEFLEKDKIEGLLRKYCRFLPVPIVFGKKQEWKDGKMQDTDEDNQINDVNPLWTRKPAELKDEDYKQFYRDLYPMQDEPLFWIHLNVDFPFHLTGVLYFPKIKSNIDVHRNKIQLYCNQVYVTDQVENIVPDFLTLLHGVIDSPDIPLNVSRSYLQSDANVKKISGYITKKVSDRLQSIFKTDRPEFEKKWDDLKLFIHYGMLSEDEFYDRAKTYALFTDTEGKHFTYDEYQTLIKDNQTDKDGTLVYLYAQNKEEQYAYIEAARAKGYSVLLMDGQLDTPLLQMLEQKFEKTRFSRVDGDTPDRLIQKEEVAKNELSDEEQDRLKEVFRARLPKMEKTEFNVAVEALGPDAAPVLITQSEYMRRMKEVSRLQPGMAFYGEMPDMYTLVLNQSHRLVADILSGIKADALPAVEPVENELKGLKARRDALRQVLKDKKEEELSDSEREEQKKCDDDIHAAEDKRKALLADFAQHRPQVSQLIDLALLQNGLLRGEALARFLQRSVELM
ncbi:MAG: molecular chaperone HtpG [Alloprevotella sp.]|nr:molecular chaperone HtpG [Alloprevotella sp.]